MSEPQSSSAGQPNRPPATKVIDLKELMGSAKELHLYHDHQVYRLRITKANKLILTK